MTPVNRALALWRAVRQSPRMPPYDIANSKSPRKRRNAPTPKMRLPEIPRHVQIKKRTRSWRLTVRRAVSSEGPGKLYQTVMPSLAAIIILSLIRCSGRTSMSSNSRTHVPYFRYFGPTAIVPGFKQMVGRFRSHRRTQYLTGSKVVQVRGSRKSNPSISSGEYNTVTRSSKPHQLTLSLFVSQSRSLH